MINALTGLGYGIIGFAVLIGIGLVVLGTLTSTVSSCPTGFGYQTNGSTTYTTGLCCATNNNTCTGTNSTNPSTASQNLYTIGGYLGTSSGGLASWIPVIIVLVIGMLFLGAFLAKKGNQY